MTKTTAVSPSPAQASNPRKASVRSPRQQKQEMDRVDAMVKREGQRDFGQSALKLCPRCGSSDLGFRRIDIPGFAPQIQVCNKCGFRSESAVEVQGLEYVEDPEEDELPSLKIEDIEKRLQSAAYGDKAGEKKPKGAKLSKTLQIADKPKTVVKAKPKPMAKTGQKPAKKRR